MTAYQRCACRPSCLSRILAGDETVKTAAGLALVAHVRVINTTPSLAGVVTGTFSPLSRRAAS